MYEYKFVKVPVVTSKAGPLEIAQKGETYRGL